MGGGLAGKDEVAAGIVDGSDDRLAGKQIVAEIDRLKMGEASAMPGQPAFRSVAFAILLPGPVLRRDELRRQGQDLLVAGGHHAGTQEGVEVFRAAVRAPARRTLRAFDLARAEVLGPIERDWHSPIQALDDRRRCRPPRSPA